MKKALSLVLALMLVLSICSAFTFAVSAEEGIAISHHNCYNWATFSAMILSGAGMNADEILAAENQTTPDYSAVWAVYKVEKQNGKYIATAFASEQTDIQALKATADGFLFFINANNAGYDTAKDGALLNKELVLSTDAIINEEFAIDTGSNPPKGYITVAAGGNDTPAAPGNALISAGKTYTMYGCNGSYPDTDDKELTDGLRAGSAAYSDAAWVGLTCNFDDTTKENGYVTITLDLGSKQDISKIGISVSHYNGDGITAPESVKVLLSDDGETWSDPVDLAYEAELTSGAVAYASVAHTASARYIEYRCYRGAGSWVFVDEVEVYGGTSGGDQGGDQGGNQGGTTTTTQTTPVFDGIAADAWVKTEVSGTNVNVVTENGKTVISGSTTGTWPWADATFTTPITLSAGDVINYDVTFESGSFSMRFNGQEGLENDSFHSLFEGADIEAGSFNLKPGTYTGTITYEQLAEMYGATDGVVTLEKVTVFSVDGAEITINKLDVVKTVTVPSGPSTPITGDAGIYAIAGLALVALIGTAVVIKKRA